MLYHFSGHSHRFIPVGTIAQVTFLFGKGRLIPGFVIVYRIRTERIVRTVIIIFFLLPVRSVLFSFRVYPLTSVTKTFLIGKIKFFLERLCLTFSRLAKLALFR